MQDRIGPVVNSACMSAKRHGFESDHVLCWRMHIFYCVMCACLSCCFFLLTQTQFLLQKITTLDS